MSKLETNTIDTVSGTSTLQVGSTNTSTITLGVSGDTINVPSGVTINNNGTQTGFGGDNTPSFGATMSTDQNNLSDGTFTLTAFDTEAWDTDGAYTNTSSNYKFTVPSGEAGKYFITAHLMFRVDSSYQAKVLRLNKNGNFLVEEEHHLSTNEWRHNYSNTVSITTVQNLSVGDYIQVYGKAVGNTWDMKQEGAYFSMHKLIGV